MNAPDWGHFNGDAAPRSEGHSGVQPALRNLAGLLPLLITATTLVAYGFISRSSSGTPGAALSLVLGAAVALIIWAAAAAVYARLSEPSTVDQSARAELSARVDALKAALHHYGRGAVSPGSDLESRSDLGVREAGAHPEIIGVEEAGSDLAVREARAHLEAIDAELSKVPWHIAFSSVHVRLRKAEEALILLQPREFVVGGALQDEVALITSGIATRGLWQAKLSLALRALNPSAACYLVSGAAADATTVEPAETSSLGEDRMARAVLRLVRSTVHTAQDQQRNELVQTRQKLTAAATMLQLCVYALFVIGVTYGVSNTDVFAIGAQFLLGTIAAVLVYLFRVSSSSKALAAGTGLERARLLASAVVGGVVGVAGVAVFAVVVATLGLAGVVPTDSNLGVLLPVSYLLAAVCGGVLSRYVLRGMEATGTSNRVAADSVPEAAPGVPLLNPLNSSHGPPH
jgi:hypothetical protein